MTPMYRNVGALMALLLLSTGAAHAQSSHEAHTSCSARAWMNGFHPEQPVYPAATDRCPADLRKPVFTREGTVACDSLDGLGAASNAMRHGWSFVPTAGVNMPGLQTGEPVTPETFGCHVYHDGTATTVEATTFAEAKTGLGWVSQSHLRN